MVFRTFFEVDHCVPFVVAKATDIVQELLMSNFVPGASLISCMRHVCITMFALHNPMSFEYFKKSIASTFGVIYLGDRKSSFCFDSAAFLPMIATSTCLFNTARPKCILTAVLFSVAYR